MTLHRVLGRWERRPSDYIPLLGRGRVIASRRRGNPFSRDCGACSERQMGILLRVCFGYASQPLSLLAMARKEITCDRMNEYKYLTYRYRYGIFILSSKSIRFCLAEEVSTVRRALLCVWFFPVFALRWC